MRPSLADADVAPTQPTVYPALFHIGYHLPADLETVRQRFAGVKFVLLAGSDSRAALLGETYRGLAAAGGGADGNAPDAGTPLPNLCTTGRFHLCQPAAAVLAASHGIGKGSADIMLHELTSLLRAAGASGYSYIRTGSCGGCGVAPGTVVLSDAVVNGEGAAEQRAVVLGTVRHQPAAVCVELTAGLRRAAEDAFGAEAVVIGKTMCCESFYEEQGRLDGALCSYTAADQARFLRHCRDDLGVVNFEMESMTLAAFCTRAAIPCAVLCAVLVDRLGAKGDTPTAPQPELREWEARPVRVAARYVFDRVRAAARGAA